MNQIKSRIQNIKTLKRLLEQNTVIHKNGRATLKAAPGDITLIHYYLVILQNMLQEEIKP